MYNISLSAFFPCHNEERNIEKLVFEAMQLLDKLVEKYQVIIVDDGSTDRTGSIADALAQKHKNVSVIHHAKNRGYGAALISGFANSVYEWVFFTDGDNQFSISELEMLLKHIEGYDLIIGFRKERKDPLHRIIYGSIWNMLMRQLFGLSVRDTNCAFKLIHKSVLDQIALHSQGAMISVELLAKAGLKGALIKQVGVSHKPRTYGNQSGDSPGVVLKAIAELFKLYREFKSCRLK